jgi:hypothetical protein
MRERPDDTSQTIYRNGTDMTDRNKQPPGAKGTPPMAFDPVEAALRQIFDDVAAEDVPADFADLVAKLSKHPRPSKDK